MTIRPSLIPTAQAEPFHAKSMTMVKSSAGNLVASIRPHTTARTILGGRPEKETEPHSSSTVRPLPCLRPNHSTYARLLTLLGTAIIVSALLDDSSNLFNVTLDGVTTSVDGARPSGPFVCDTLFSQSGLDVTKEHEISVVIGGPSPTANATLQDSSQWSLLLDNFM